MGFEVRAVGRVESPLRGLAGAPRQADEGAPPADLVFADEYAPALGGLEPARGRGGGAEVLAVEGTRVRVDRLEAVHGTPVVDLKPVPPPPGRR